MMNNTGKPKVVIVDDEKHGRDTIRLMLFKNYPEVEICGEAVNVRDAINIIKDCSPDIVFLDIELAGGTGFDILEAVDDISFEIIFATAYNYYAIKAIKFSALDYLLKPVDQEELKTAMDKAITKIGQKTDKKTHLDFFKEQVDKPVPDKIALPTDNGFKFIKIRDILRCNAESNYTRFFLDDKTSVLTCHTLGEYEKLLSEYNFIRIHNSHLVNMHHVSSYIKGKGGFVVMSDGSEVEVSVRRKDKFLRTFAKL